MKRIIVLAALLTLAGCNSTPLGPTVTQYKVITPTKAMYDCPLYKEWPNPDKLTDVQVAKTLVKLYKNNVRCKNAIDAIEKYLNRAKETVEGPVQPEPSEERPKLFGIF